MPNRIPTPGVSTPAVRKSPTAQPAMKPVENAESQLAKKLQSGKVKDLNATRAAIAKKTGVWPNGKTN